MPELCRFYGIIIRMFYNDHLPPHFHAEYSGHEAQFNINTLALISGKLPPRAMGLVMEWACLHQDELKAEWEKAANLQLLGRISPLD